MHETFDHTADLGLRVRAGDLDTLFAEAGVGLFAMMIENPDAVRPAESQAVELTGTDREFLLFDWLRELLYRFDAEHWVFARFDVTVRDDGLTATVHGEKLDRTRHHLSHEVKAITYHDLKVEPDGDGWLAEVIVDI
jgi:SHS2 domain-containing protein